MSLFFTSDLHFGHGNIMKYSHRPGLTDKELLLLKEEEEENRLAFKENRRPDSSKRLRVSDSSVKVMDDYLIEGINSTVGVNDTLRILGDFCFGPKDDILNVARRYRNAIKCKDVHIVWGNHDNYAIRSLFSSAMDMCTVRHEGQDIVCLHYAMVTYNKSHRGVWHLYGHSHSGLESWMDEHMPERRSMDVGVDNAAKLLGSYRPFAYEEIKKIMDSKKGFSADHHK